MDDDEQTEEMGGNQLGLTLPSPNPSKSISQQQNASLEALLAAKNKRLTDELTKLRVSLGLDSFGILNHIHDLRCLESQRRRRGKLTRNFRGAAFNEVRTRGKENVE